jgi:hypothetical protein
MTWLREISLNLAPNSSSFINVLANAYVNSFDTSYVTTPTPINYVDGVDVPPPTCKTLPGQNVVLCNTTMNFEADAQISTSEFTFINACNGAGTDTSGSGNPPKIFTFSVSHPPGGSTIPFSGYAAQIIPIFEGGTATITADPPLTDAIDIAAIGGTIVSGATIDIRSIPSETVFELTVSNAAGLTDFEDVTVPAINNTIPAGSNNNSNNSVTDTDTDTYSTITWISIITIIIGILGYIGFKFFFK